MARICLGSNEGGNVFSVERELLKKDGIDILTIKMNMKFGYMIWGGG